MTITAPLLKARAKEYVATYYDERLRREGFVPSDRNALCWYRVIDKQVVNTVCFFTRFSRPPVTIQMGYGTHPLFLKPYMPEGVYIYNLDVDRELFAQQTMFVGGTFHARASGILGYFAIGDEQSDNCVFSQMGRVRTIEDCYRLHKNTYLGYTHYPVERRFNMATGSFIDEAIYMNDPEVIPYCQKRVVQLLEMYKGRSPEKLNWAKQQYRALFEDGRDAYMTVLKEREQETIKWLREKLGIIV